MREEEWRIISGKGHNVNIPLYLSTLMYPYAFFTIFSHPIKILQFAIHVWDILSLHYIIISFFIVHIFLQRKLLFDAVVRVLLQQFVSFQKVTDKAPSIFFPGCFNMNTLCFSYSITAIYHVPIYRIICSQESHRQSLPRTITLYCT